MNKWNPERAEAIRLFIDEYFMEKHGSPSVREIAAATGISKTAVQRYLTEMKESGEIEYNGRRGIGTSLSREMREVTPAARYESILSGDPPEMTRMQEMEAVPIPISIVGEGDFFVLTIRGDAMSSAGLADGDHVIVRKQDTCRDGEVAVVAVNETETLFRTITYLPEKQTYLLHAKNPNYCDRIEREVQILGVAVQVIKPL